MRIARGKIGRLGLLGALLTTTALLLAAPSPAMASAVWRIDSLSNPSAAPGSTLNYLVQVTNLGDKAAPEVVGGNTDNCIAGAPAPADPSKCIRVIATVPAGITPLSGEETSGVGALCAVAGQTIACSAPGHAKSSVLGPREKLELALSVAVEPGAAGTLTASFEVNGAGASADTTIDATRIDPAPPQFGVGEFDAQASADAAGTLFTRAGGHPFAYSNAIEFNSVDSPNIFRRSLWPVEATRDVVVDLPPGFVANLSGVDQCTAGDLASGEGFVVKSTCPSTSQVGTALVRVNGFGSGGVKGPLPLFNMIPPVGVPARLGFNVFGTMVSLDGRLRSDSDYGISVASRSISQGLDVQSTIVDVWNLPAEASHDFDRSCPGEEPPWRSGKTCTSGAPGIPLLRMPTSCAAEGSGLATSIHADSWQHPAGFDANGDPDLSDPNWSSQTILSHGAPGYPAAPGDWGAPQGPSGCAQVPVRAELSAQMTALDTETPSGLAVHVEVPNPGLENPNGIASSDVEAVEVALPQGVTINPSQADGLGVCSPAQYASSRLEFNPDGQHGCPTDSKIGTVSVKTPLLEETVPGDVYIAAPHDNPFNSLLALYVVMQEPQRGVQIKLAGKVSTEERSGQITAEFGDLPQLPFSSFDFRFREGARAPLVTPPTCGTYETVAEFTPWSDPSRTLTNTSPFQITRGIGGGACPAGAPPFKPGLVAGSLNNHAGAFSPFNLRLFRSDAEQEITHFSIKLPPGLTGKLAGVTFCSDASIEAAKSSTRTGAQEISSPSCPKASEVGRTLVGAGVGSVLTYVPGKVYLAGPYNGSPLSIAAITAAKAGPFDLGTVVVREALRINPETAEVFIDATGSDPIPHIIDGITVHLRDIRAYVDRPQFALNPTSCKPTSTASTVLGSGLDFTSAADDVPVTVSTRYQAAGCASLGFKPKLALSLKGGTKRGQNPAFKAVLTARKGDANIGEAQVTLPHSEFLDNEHIRTICTRVQYAQGAVPGEKCPAGSVYGYAKAVTPLLDEPLQGPVYLRSSSNKLPDLVAALHSGRIHINLDGRIDSVKGGRIRNTFEAVPDAPVTQFTLTMRGGKKGLLVNSTNLCKGSHKALATFTGQNGKLHEFSPELKAQCKGKKDKKAKRGAKGAR